VHKGLAGKLRPHQVEGVKFLFDACMGRRGVGRGCILADDMGLGKTLMTLTTIYTFLKQGPRGKPEAGNAAVICPTSLVHNWAAEVHKWLGGDLPKMQMLVVSSESSKATIESNLRGFQSRRGGCLLILSYDTARIYRALLQPVHFGLLVCDEAHKLKNKKTALYSALFTIRSTMRIMVTGTPVQNGLEEFHALLDFCIPDCLGTPKEFDKRVAKPIEHARNLDATDREVQLGRVASASLDKVVNQVMLRRQNDVIAKYLPAKLDVIVFCTLTEEQQSMYRHASTEGRKAVQVAEAGGKQVFSSALRAVSTLKRIVNDPEMAQLAQRLEAMGHESSDVVAKLAEARAKAPPDPVHSVALSGKLSAMIELLVQVKRTTDERFVLISNFTTTLDIFEAVLKAHALSFTRLDGSLPPHKRQERVDSFNSDPSCFAFLLSSKAGGCGINLIGANRLILFDPDWNPAIDQQALARVWRSGQQKPCYVYRFFGVGSLEEVCYERQVAKEGLAAGVVDGDQEARKFSAAELKSLFSPNFESRSNFHDRSKCPCCTQGGMAEPDANGMSHTLPGSEAFAEADPCLARAAEVSGRISLIFTKVTDAGGRGFAVPQG